MSKFTLHGYQAGYSGYLTGTARFFFISYNIEADALRNFLMRSACYFRTPLARRFVPTCSPTRATITTVASSARIAVSTVFSGSVIPVASIFTITAVTAVFTAIAAPAPRRVISASAITAVPAIGIPAAARSMVIMMAMAVMLIGVTVVIFAGMGTGRDKGTQRKGKENSFKTVHFSHGDLSITGLVSLASDK
ncbi:hypothetical protein [Pantoea sp. Sc1]|uniref:hypothetical protein n=1 Tax=Pantoea sp. Sc1 TaxID=593105 RepID=UPI001300C260|nr:hypothetical protein [Pantoea sp. Sc1]